MKPIRAVWVAVILFAVALEVPGLPINYSDVALFMFGVFCGAEFLAVEIHWKETLSGHVWNHVPGMLPRWFLGLWMAKLVGEHVWGELTPYLAIWLPLHFLIRGGVEMRIIRADRG